MADEKAKPIRDLVNIEDMDDLTRRKHRLRSMTQSLSPTDAAAVLSTGKEGGIAGCSDLARASQRADAYNRYGADLLRLIDKLPPGHPERARRRAQSFGLCGRGRFRRWTRSDRSRSGMRSSCATRRPVAWAGHRRPNRPARLPI